MTSRITRWIAAILIPAAVLVACSDESAPDELVLMTHDSFALSEGTLDAFTEQTGITVIVQTAGDAGSMVNQAVLTKDNPIADVIYGIDNTFLSRAVEEGVFVPHTAAGIDAVVKGLRVEGDPVTPIDFGDVCVNYDINALDEAGVAPPTSIRDLTDPVYRGLVVVEDPAASSPGLAFLLATIATFGEDGDYPWTQYWEDLFANDVTVASDWSDAYLVEFTRAGGERPIVVSYASSPPAEVLFGELDAAPTAAVLDGCFRQIEYAGVVAGRPHTEAAAKLVDFLLTVEVQEDIPLNMFVYPANAEAQLPDVFATHTVFPPSPITVDPAAIQANRERWINEWVMIARS